MASLSVTLEDLTANAIATTSISGTSSITLDDVAREYTLGESWYLAETTIFDALKTYLGHTENIECYRGYLPTRNTLDEYEKTNVWMIDSGGSDNFDVDVLVGCHQPWGVLRMDAYLDSIWETRKGAMEFAGQVLTWLRSTSNLAETANIEWCRLKGIPEQPQRYKTSGERPQILWQQQIELEIVYRTDSVFN